MTTNRKHLLPFGGANTKGMYAPRVERVETLEDALTRSARVRAERDARIAAAKAARPVPTGAMVGSRYSGGFSASARCR